MSNKSQRSLVQGLILLWLVILVGLCLTGCTIMDGRSGAMATQVTGGKIETTGSISSSTVAPNVMGGSISTAITTSVPVKEGQVAPPSVALSYNSSWLGKLFGFSNDSYSFAYTGVPGESAKDTVSRLKAFSDAVATVTKAKAEQSTE